MGHRDSVVGRNRQRRGHPGDDLEGDAVGPQKLQLLAAASEEERIAAFQPHHAFSLQRLLEENPVDLLLGLFMVSRLFSHVDGLRPGGNP